MFCLECDDVPLFCTDCDLRGIEKAAPGTQGDFTLESCKQACIDDSTCFGIDFGYGECYLTTSQLLDDNGYIAHSGFNGYKKMTCGMKLFILWKYIQKDARDLEYVFWTIPTKKFSFIWK